MKITAEPRSDQINADDLIGGPMTVTIADVKAGAAEKKYDIALVGETRVWRPPLTVLRIMIQAWGNERDDWIGQSVTLFCDPDVRFGPDQVGGIRISHMTGITETLHARLSTKRGKRGLFTVEPLAAPPVPALSDRIESAAIAFEGLNVSREQLAGFVGKPESEWTAADLDGLASAFQSLQAGTMTVAEMLGGAE